MADPRSSSPNKKAFFVVDLSGQNSNPIIPSQFIANHIKGKTLSTKLKLTSVASDRTWEVELDGGRFAAGWKNFSVFHAVRDDDVLSFRHDGDMVFHVTPLGRSFSQIHLISSSSTTSDSDDEHRTFDDDEDDSVDVGDDDGDDDNSISEDDLYSKKLSSKKRARTETEYSSEESYLLAHVTPSSLLRDTLCLLIKFAKSNGLDKRVCEIDLMDEDGKSWTLLLRHNKKSGQAFVRGGWRKFCRNNGIKAGSLCRFKLVQSGTKPVLQLCPNTSSIPEGNSSKANKKGNVSESEGDEIETEDCSETVPVLQNKILTLDLKPYMIGSSQFRVPASLARENGILKAGEVTVLNKDGEEWKSHLVNVKGRDQFYIRSCKEFFLANGIKNVGDPFTLEVIRGGTSPILKICSKVKQVSFDGYKTLERKPRMTVQAPHAEDETENRVQKKARVCTEGGPSRCTRALNKSSTDPGNLQRKQPLQPCSISDHVKKVRQSIMDTLTDVRRFRSELEIKEQNLQASLHEIDALGEKIMGISQIFNISQA
ncbi:PREDICTED: putative B3 domain-containing protein REM4 isoform X1 [Camelina sativa]|uniref:B3 domain-containing protein REM4 isoform X1 n=1 Tax=Camelina sativa TaxID=90675 RepID=A0ABM0TXE8_CAMSA|nr:PREDICTED: putative B3 domain-containing protein REM4 isoform X1 [Camelina sativa]